MSDPNLICCLCISLYTGAITALSIAAFAISRSYGGYVTFFYFLHVVYLDINLYFLAIFASLLFIIYICIDIYIFSLSLYCYIHTHTPLPLSFKGNLVNSLYLIIEILINEA